MTQMEGYMTENDMDITVVLDCNLTEELLEEGFVREIVSKIQTMRKEADFEVTDRIKVSYEAEGKCAEIFAKYGNDILSEVLGEELIEKSQIGYTKAWKINGEDVTLGVSKL